MSGRPFGLQWEHGFIAHPARTANHGLDGRVQELDEPEAHRMDAGGGNALEVLHEVGAQLLHFWQSLSAERLQPAHKEGADTLPSAAASAASPAPSDRRTRHARSECRKGRLASAPLLTLSPRTSRSTRRTRH